MVRHPALWHKDLLLSLRQILMKNCWTSWRAGNQWSFIKTYLLGSHILSWLVTTSPFSRIILHSLCIFSSTEPVECRKKSTKVFLNGSGAKRLTWSGKSLEIVRKRRVNYIDDRYVRYLRKLGVDVLVKVEGDAEED